MSNVGQPNLFNISKGLLNIHREQRFYATRFIKSLMHGRNANNSPCIFQSISFAQILQFQKSYFSSENDSKSTETSSNNQQESEQEQSFRSESASYRQQARNSYERKRSNYHGKSQTNGQARDELSSVISVDISHYQRLNINRNAGIGDIKSAYYSLSKMYHPDIVGLNDKLAAENFRLVTESYEVLSDPDRKATYDKELDIASRQSNLSDIFRRSSKHRDKDFNFNFRSRNSDMIFRAMQDSALELEKLKNPEKFRAGSFERSYGDDEERLRFQSLSKRLTHLKSQQGWSGKVDGSDFYKMHLFDTIKRRHDDMMMSSKDFGSVKCQTHLSETDVATLVVAIGAAFIGLVVVIMSYFDTDPTAALDDKLVEYMQTKKAESAENGKPSRNI